MELLQDRGYIGSYLNLCIGVEQHYAYECQYFPGYPVTGPGKMGQDLDHCPHTIQLNLNVIDQLNLPEKNNNTLFMLL